MNALTTRRKISTDLLQLGHVGDVVVPPLSLLLLQLDGDASHGAALESLHQVSDEPGNLRLSLQNHATNIDSFHPGISSIRRLSHQLIKVLF